MLHQNYFQQLEHKEDFSNKNYSLINLIPSNILSCDFKNAIRKYLNIVDYAYDALLAFEKQDMQFFDPIAGDCACQIRAVFFATLINQAGMDESISHFKLIIKEHSIFINNLIAHLNPRQKNNHFSLKEYFYRYNSCPEITENIAIIIISYIISLAKEPEPYLDEDGIVIYRVKTRPGNFLFKTVKRAQQELTKLSVIYLQRLAVLHENDRKYIDSNCVRYDLLNRSLLPCYPLTKLLLRELSDKQVPILLNIKLFIKYQTEHYDQFSIIYDSSENSYCETQNPSMFEGRCAFMVSAKSVTKEPICPNKLRAELLNYNIEDLILSALSTHPQYICGQDWHPIDIGYENHRKLALELGTCRENPTACMIDHIYCGVIKN